MNGRETGLLGYAVLFDVLLLIVVAVLLLDSGSLGPQARLVPQVVGIPVLAATAALTVFDLRRVRSWRQGKAEHPSERKPPTVETVALGLSDGDDEDSELGNGATRQVSLAVWSVGLLLMGWAFGFLVAIPISLGIILWIVTRSLKLTLTATVITWAVLFLVFVQLLRTAL